MNWGVRPSDVATGWRVAGGDHCGRPEPSPVLCQAQPSPWGADVRVAADPVRASGFKVSAGVCDIRGRSTRGLARVQAKARPCAFREVRTTHRRHRGRRPSGSWQRPAPTAGPFKVEVGRRPEMAAHVQLEVLIPAAGRLRAARSMAQTRAKWPPGSLNAPRKRWATGCSYFHGLY